eukprot:NODE_19673_length_832_cov_7.564539.p1 GENE.NODE_19673_length_832_cov_7.564539~~NODE_19673_length_832_cov_7.564539.p1  ORF type:complete len:203 (+),score=28.28 NODE_19673_length_832_cov_7.564539:91-699(+)
MVRARDPAPQRRPSAGVLRRPSGGVAAPRGGGILPPRGEMLPGAADAPVAVGAEQHMHDDGDGDGDGDHDGDGDASGVDAPAPPAAQPPLHRGAGERKRRRRGARPVEREIRSLQSDHRYLSFSKIGFARLVRDIQSRFSEEPLRWSAEALLLFQTAAEEYLMYLYADAYLATHHRRCVTLTTEDLRLVRRLRQPHCWGESM